MNVRARHNARRGDSGEKYGATDLARIAEYQRDTVSDLLQLVRRPR